MAGATRRWMIPGLWLVACASPPDGGGVTDSEGASTSATATATATTAGPTTGAPTTADASSGSSGEVTDSTDPTASTSDATAGSSDATTGSSGETTDATTTGSTTGATTTTGTGQTDATVTGSSDTGAFACDGAPLWDDPHADGSLRLAGAEHYGLDAGPHPHSWICVEDAARLNVCEDTVIELLAPIDTVIGGDGIGPLGDEKVSITVVTEHPVDLHVLVDLTGPPVDIWVDAPAACVTVTAKGGAELGFGGTGSSARVSTEGPLTLNGWAGTGETPCPFMAEFSAGGGVIPPPPCP